MKKRRQVESKQKERKLLKTDGIDVKR